MTVAARQRHVGGTALAPFTVNPIFSRFQIITVAATISTSLTIPRVFACHASEDKERFVISFATALRSRGIDVWVDQWEICPGDSLVRKIFDEGIGSADAAMIVPSPYSVIKPWVREESDSAFVARVERQVRIIPVIIENCDIPLPIRHLKYIRVKQLSHPQEEADEIERMLFNSSIKPPIGSAPGYARLPDLQYLDSRRRTASYSSLSEIGSLNKAATSPVLRKSSPAYLISALRLSL